jgi:hypothetical protein
MTEDEIFYRAWAAGLSTSSASFLATQFHGDPPVFIRHFIKTMFRGVAVHRTRNQMKRYVVRNRRAYNHDQALIARHEREVLRARDGMRCHQCRAVPPQPGEVMDPDCVKYLATLE